MAVTVNELKTYAKIETTAEDDLLQDTIDAAQKHIENVLGTTFADIGDTTPEPLKQAVLMLAAHWHELRGAAGAENMRPFPFGVEQLLNEYREFDFS